MRLFLKRRISSGVRMRRSTISGRRVLVACALLSAIGPSTLEAQEFIIHANGDSINGDVKGFKHGKLEFEIPGGSSTYIEFDDISAVGSPDFWDVELDDLTREFGSLAPGTEPGSILIARESGSREVQLSRIVAMTSIDAGFWAKMDGFLEFGFSFAKANSVTNYTLATRVDYRGTRWASGLSFDSRLNSQDGAETTKRNQASINFTRLLPKTWYAGVFTQLEQNQELDLDLRFLLGALGGRDIIQSKSSTGRTCSETSISVRASTISTTASRRRERARTTTAPRWPSGGIGSHWIRRRPFDPASGAPRHPSLEAIFAQLSRSVTVRLNTRPSALESIGSLMK